MKYTMPILFLFIISCGVEQKDFNKTAWNKKDGISYTNRESMVKDLMENHLHKGMTFQEVIDLIGQPENYANMKPNTIGYEIMVEYGWNIDPVEGKNLYIELSKDSTTVIDYSLKHWKH